MNNFPQIRYREELKIIEVPASIADSINQILLEEWHSKGYSVQIVID